jgi:hypothetical protein
MNADEFRTAALALPGAEEGAHMKHADFRVGGKVFATLGYPDANWAVLQLTPEQQAIVVGAEPEIFRPVKGGWGLKGSTQARLERLDATTAESALRMAWEKATARRPSARRQGK